MQVLTPWNSISKSLRYLTNIKMAELSPATFVNENPTSPAPRTFALATAMIPAHTLTMAVMKSIRTDTHRFRLNVASWVLERGRNLLAKWLQNIFGMSPRARITESPFIVSPNCEKTGLWLDEDSRFRTTAVRVYISPQRMPTAMLNKMGSIKTGLWEIQISIWQGWENKTRERELRELPVGRR